MSTQTTTYTTGGTYTYTASALLLGGSVAVSASGSAGQTLGSVKGGDGETVVATLPIAASGTLTVYVGDTSGTSGHGYHLGGAGAASNQSYGNQGGHGGASSGVLGLLEAGGGGGAGGLGQYPNGGVGGAAALVAGAGAAGSGYSPLDAGHGGGGANNGTGGTGGAYGVGLSSHGTAGSNASGGTGGSGGAADTGSGTGCGGGGGGGGGHAGGGGGGGGSDTGGGGGGGGGSSAYGSYGSHGGVWASTPGQVQIVATVCDPPLASVLLSPAAGSSLDANAVGVVFDWTYKPGANSGTQQAYALRVSQDGAAYQYWNATSGALQSSAVWNSYTGSTATIPAGVLADGHTYTWSVATQENYYGLPVSTGSAVYASDYAFIATAQPTVTITAPTGTVASAAPIVSWTETLGGGDSQISYRVVVYTAAVAASPGFSPGVTTPTVDSGVVASAATLWTVSSALSQGSWVVYVQIVETGPVASAWASSAFTVGFDSPATPLLYLAPSVGAGGAPVVTATIIGQDNLLQTDDASFETSIGTWVQGANTTASQSSTYALDGTWSMKLLATGTGTVSAATSPSTTYPVQANATYAFMASFFAGSTGRSMSVIVQWFTSGGSLISTSTASVTDSSGGWTQASALATAPATAAYAVMEVTSAVSVAGSEAHYVDEVGLFYITTGTIPAWSRGGIIGLQEATLLRSIDGGVTFTAVRGATNIAVPATTEEVVVVDYEMPFGASVTYEAVISATVALPVAGTVTSAPATAATVTLASQWALMDPLNPTTNILLLHRLGTTDGPSTTLTSPVSFAQLINEQQGVFYGWGNPDAIVQHGTLEAPTFNFYGLLEGYAERNMLLALQALQATLQLRSDMGDSWYITMGAVSLAVLRETNRINNPLFTVSFPCTVTSAP